MVNSINESSLISVKAHTRSKHRILGKYLGACERFSQKYKNFAYVDTHGGTGQVFDLAKGEVIDGSTLIAARTTPSFPCYAVEIDPDHFAQLESFTKELEHVTVFVGDCNQLIDDILDGIPKGSKFVFCFVDPQKLMYGKGTTVCPQLTWETVEKIARVPRTEILLNLPLHDIMRQAGVVRESPNDPASEKRESYITTFYGSKDWKEVEPGDYEGLLRLYVSTRLGRYRFRGAILIRAITTRAPLYYLVYGSKHKRGGEIMRDIMKKEWVDEIVYRYPLERYLYSTDRKWLNAEYPLDRPFVFQD